MNELADRHPRYGYRRIWRCFGARALPSTESESSACGAFEGHRVPPRRAKNSGGRAQGQGRNAPWSLPAACPNEVWSYDFVSTRTRNGSAIRILNVVDEYTRLALGCRVATSIGATHVRAFLQELFEAHGKPRIIRSDNGRGFIASSLVAWLADQGVRCAFIEKGRPQQNPYVERFNGTMRDEQLNGEEFVSVGHPSDALHVIPTLWTQTPWSSRNRSRGSWRRPSAGRVRGDRSRSSRAGTRTSRAQTSRAT